jgi:DNA polymerase III subunit gamma/tau
MNDSAIAYRVLARKYRPSTFAELIGQEAMVRTLSNAFATGRVAHAFILTGVRGVGKTTTARILARGLNCVGPDGSGGPTIAPCGVCANCRQIAEDRYSDVVEMDAASRTGVDDIRELTEGLLYRKPDLGRYRVYIIDEVHMLSRSAFNALLKTLEEPPPHAKFVFATTEIQKIPLTVLSRCQRFSLRRVPVELLAEHYRRIAEAEAVEAEPAALALIARAADGSVRDGLSLLDQAIALSALPREAPGASGEAKLRPELTDARVTEKAVRDMLGIADRGQVLDLLESVLRGDAGDALDRMDRLYQNGADPLMVLQDLLDLSHFLTRLKLAPEAGVGDPIAEGDRKRAGPLAEKLALPVLARVWQMLLKGLEEVQAAPSPIQAAEMVLVRLAYVTDLPVPAELVRSLATSPAPGGRPVTEEPPANRASGAEPPPRSEPVSAVAPGSFAVSSLAAAAPRLEPEERTHPLPRSSVEHDPMPQSFAEVVALFDKRREAVIRSHLREHVHLVAFEPGRIEFRPDEGAPGNLANRISQLLGEWTGERWLVARSEAAPGELTLREQEERRERDLRNEVVQHPLVQAVLETFPGATIAAVRDRFAPAEPEPGEPRSGSEAGDETIMEEDEI